MGATSYQEIKKEEQNNWTNEYSEENLYTGRTLYLFPFLCALQNILHQRA